jgi:hypothetical protein
MRYTTVYVALSLLLWLHERPQTRHAPPTPTDRAVISPSSPLKLVTYRNGYKVTNVSDKRIVKYTLGCALEEDKKLRIVHVLPPQESSLEPGMQMGHATIDNPDEAIFECIEKRKSKLAVVEVDFADGAAWRLTHR